jgi:NADH-quinone oxidoreductase subunit J
MMEADIAFFVLSGITLAAAIFSLESRQVVYGAIALAFSFLGIAGLFILLDATYVALFQIIVYVGAVAVLILFTVMLVTREVEAEAKREPVQPLGVAIAVIVAILVTFVASLSDLGTIYPAATNFNVSNIGSLLANQYAFPLEILALILGASIVGALTMAKVDKEPLEEEEQRPAIVSKSEPIVAQAESK